LKKPQCDIVENSADRFHFIYKAYCWRIIKESNEI